jgi:hypothetical protein
MVGFNYIGVRVEDLVMAAATIQAAQIQANYNFWAVLLSSGIGAAGIIYAAWYAWQSGIKLHQHNNILEAKREVYLDAIAKYQQLVNDLQLINIVPEQFFEILLNNNRDFFIAINKVKLICDHINKDMVEKFALEAGKGIHSLMPLINKFLAKKDDLNSYSEKLMAFIQDKDLNNLSIADLRKIEVKELTRNELRAEFIVEKEKLEKAVQELVTNLEVENEKFSAALRRELKISDNLV